MNKLIRKPFPLVVKTFEGLEPILAEEMRKLGATHIRKLQRAVRGEGDVLTLYRLNLMSRTALKVLIQVAEFELRDKGDLYDVARRIAWEEFISPEQSLLIESMVQSRFFESQQDAQREVRDAINDRFRQFSDAWPKVDYDKPDLRIQLLVNQNKALIQIDTSGLSLHRRGYREDVAEVAPLNELVAAATLLYLDYDGRQPLILPPGTPETLVAEAALIARHLAPGLCGREFAVQQWKSFDKPVWNTVKAQVQERSKTGNGSIQVIEPDATRAERLMKVLKATHCADAVQILRMGWNEYTAPVQGGMLLVPPTGTGGFPATFADVDARFTGKPVAVLTSLEEVPSKLSPVPERRWELYQGKAGYLLARYDSSLRVPGF